MWKRLPLRDRAQKGKEARLHIGSPTLVESTYDEQQLDRAQDLSPSEEPQLSPYYNADIRPSRARQDLDTQLQSPTMNVPQERAQGGLSYRPSVAASSVYSQQEDRISPPTSPYRKPVYDDGQVSPIEELSPAERPSKSQIPVARKVTPRMKEWTQNVGKGAPMMWDDYSGEPTFDGAGKPSQVKPGQYDYRTGLKAIKKERGPPAAETTDLAKTAAGFKEKAARLAQQGLSVDTRPPWKGSSGRQVIMDAPRDKPGQPLPKPRRKEVSLVESPGANLSNNPVSPASQNVARRPETRQVAVDPEVLRTEETNYNASSERDMHNSGPSPYSDRYGTPTRDYHYSPGATIDPSEQHPAFRNGGSRGVYASEDSPPRKARNDLDSRTIEDSPSQHPASRFSWTTKASSTYQQDVPSSPPPPMPTKYMNEASPEPQASMLDRGHPTRRLGTDSPSPTMGGRSFSAGSTLRKPVASTLAVQPPDTPTEPEVIRQQFPMGDWRSGLPKDRAVSAAPSILSNNSGVKSLPKTPQELSSPDLIASLQAQQSDLSQQRRNLQRVIADLEAPEAKNPITNSFKVIREREKQLDSLKLDLADVLRRDHELGMRLHRAWKRKERDDPSAPGSTFWVRRATAG